jgi:uncharacterized glyoxalase superfamily metalloenzyme YdcJ
MESDTSAYWRIAGVFPMCRKASKVIAHMTESTIRELRQQNQQLHKLLVSLSAVLLRKVATESKLHGPCSSADAERFVHEAEECFRCARIPGLKQEIAEGLEVAGHELMAMAVDIETRLQRLKRRT